MGSHQNNLANLLAVASRVHTQCFMTAVVPTHRCGAAQESHRIPYHPDPRWSAGCCTGMSPAAVISAAVRTSRLYAEENARPYRPEIRSGQVARDDEHRYAATGTTDH
jgi:hypothetical protein